MSHPEASSFHKFRSLRGVLHSVIESEAPRDTNLPLHQVLLPALDGAIDQAETDGEDRGQGFQEISAELERWQKLLSELQETANRWYVFQAHEWHFSPKWWSEEFENLRQAFAQNAQEGANRWIRTFTEALVEWDLEGGQKLVEQSYPFPDHLAFVPLMFEDGLQKLREGNLPAAEDMLSFLIQGRGGDSGQPKLEPSLQAAVLILLARIATAKGNEEESQAKLKQARELAPMDGRPLAALGSYHRSKGQYEQAAALLREAVKLSPDQPEGYTAMAILMEEQKFWDESHAWYKQAVGCALQFPDPFRVLERLRAPVTGNLFFHLAQGLRDVAEDRALLAVELALKLGMKGSLPYPDVIAYTVKGDLLNKQGKKTEAALAYYEAGRRSGWNDDYESATTLLRQARDLDKTYQPTYWYLADDLRMVAVSPKYSQETPESQQEKDKLIRESLQIWEEGVALGKITAENSWTLITRAILTEVLPERRTVPAKELSLFSWDALFFVERYLLNSDKNALGWTYLARYYRFLGLEASNLYALDRAAELDANVARDEKLIRSVNRGEFEEAEKLIENLLADKTFPNQNWVRNVKGFILSRNGKWEEALKVSDENPTESWVRIYRAVCFMNTGNIPAAIKQYEKLWEKHADQDNDSLVEYAFGGLHLALLIPEHAADLDLAIEFARRRVESPTEPFVPNALLGYTLLAKGENLAEGRRLLEKSIPLANNPRELREQANLFIPILQNLMKKLPHGEKAADILEEIRQGMLRQITAVGQKLRTPEEELSKELERIEHESHSGMPADLMVRVRLGIRAGLARLHLRAGRWIDATDAYQALGAQYDLIPETPLGLAKALEGLHQAAKERFRQAEYLATLPLLERVARLTEYLGQRDKLPEVYCQLAFAHLELSADQPDANLSPAGAYFIKTAELFREQGRKDVWSGVSENVRKLLTSVRQYWKIDESLGNLLAKVKPSPAVGNGQMLAGIQDLRQALDDYLGEKYNFGNPYQGNPAINRIAIELGRDLLPPGNSQEWELMNLYIPSIRRELQRKFGMEIPGVHIRLATEGLMPDEYRIVIDGQQLAKKLIVGDSNSALAISSQLHGVLTFNLDRFMNVHAAARLLKEWQRINTANYLTITRAFPDEQSRMAFGRVLSELAREGVPANQPAEILSVIKESDIMRANRAEIVRKLRLALKPHLPGNTGEARRVELPPDLEDDLLSYLQVQKDQVFLVLPIQEQERFLSSIRALLERPPAHGEDGRSEGHPTREVALICRDAALRPALRRMIEQTLPEVAVLSFEETSSEVSKETGQTAG
jgi:tetratricopeptide (TPR) repeat protein